VNGFSEKHSLAVQRLRQVASPAWLCWLKAAKCWAILSTYVQSLRRATDQACNFCWILRIILHLSSKPQEPKIECLMWRRLYYLIHMRMQEPSTGFKIWIGMLRLPLQSLQLCKYHCLNDLSYGRYQTSYVASVWQLI